MVGAGVVGGLVLFSPGAAFAGDLLPGEGRGSTPEERQAQGSSPRLGNNFDPSKGRFEHSYDWKNPTDTTGNPVKFPWLQPPAQIPRDLVVVRNYMADHDPQHRDAHDNPKDAGRDEANMVGTDVMVPGGHDHLAGFTMGCPRRGQRVGNDQRPNYDDHDGYWTGSTVFDTEDRRVHFSYQMGDRMADDAWLWWHYAFWGAANPS